MKSKIFILSGVVSFLFILHFYLLPNVLLNLMRSFIAGALPGYDVKVGKLELGLTTINVKDVLIQNSSDKIVVPNISIKISLSELNDRKVSGVVVSNASVDLLLNNGALDVFGEKGQGRSTDTPKEAWSIKAIRLDRIKFKVKHKDLSVEGIGSIGILPAQKEVSDIVLENVHIESGSFMVKNMGISARQGEHDGSLTAGPVKFDKNEINQITATVFLDKETVSFQSIQADFWNGKISGSVNLDWAKLRYLLELTADGVDLEAIAKGYELAERVDMTGKLQGYLKLAGQGVEINEITGAFQTADPGGKLNITDKKLLAAIAQYTGQSPEILMESFKNFNYSKGNIGASLDSGNIVLSVNLSGDNGRRNLQVVLHDFLNLTNQ